MDTLSEAESEDQIDMILWDKMCDQEMQYGGNVGFFMLEVYIEHEGLDKYFVADKKVYDDGKKIKGVYVG